MKKEIDWDDEIIEAIARRKAVLVIGSGVSKNSKDKKGNSPKSWKEFLDSHSEKINNKVRDEIIKRIEKSDFLMACELIKLEMENKEPNSFFKAIKKDFKTSAFSHAEIHEHIFELDVSIIITPNFDSIYETYASSKSNGTIQVRQYYDDIAQYIRGGDERVIIKSHGSASDTHKVIFTHEDYAKARTEHMLFYEIIKSLALTHTFLFIGCGINDPDIRMLFEDIRYSYGKVLPYHYMTIPSNSEDESIKNIFSKMTNIRFLEYSSENNHINLTSSIKKLLGQVQEKRDELAGNQKW